MVKVDLSGAMSFIGSAGLDYALAAEAHRTLADGTGAGSEFTGWLKLPELIRDTELKRIVSAGERIRSNSEALVVIGIGGSYLGARAAVELLAMPKRDGTPDVYFAGCGLSPDALNETIAAIGDRDFSVNVVSKSGTTLEPALAFRVFKGLLEKKYGAAAARKRIYATTDAHRGSSVFLLEQGRAQVPGRRRGVRVLRGAGRCRRAIQRALGCWAAANGRGRHRRKAHDRLRDS